MFSLELKK